MAKDNDSMAYSWIIEKERLNKYGLHRPVNSFLKASAVLPSLMQRLVAIFPMKYKVQISRLLVIVFDLMFVLSGYLLFYELQVSYTLIYDHQGLFSSAFYVALIVSSTPLLFPASSRVMSMGARTLSTLISFLFFSVLGYSMIANWYYGYAILVLLLLIAVLTSLFTVQCLTLISLVLSAVFGSIFPLLSVLIGWGVAYFIPQLGAKVVISEFMVSKWIWYYKNQKAKGITKRNSITNFLKLPLDLLNLRMKAFSTIFANNSLLIVLHSFPLLIVYFVFQMSGDIVFLKDQNWDTYLYALVISTMVVFVLTSFRKFLFLGQAERYLEFLVVPISVGVMLNILTNYPNLFPELALLVVVYNLIMVVISYLYNKRFELQDGMKETVPDTLKSLGEFLKSLDNTPLNIITIPTKFAYYLSLVSGTSLKYYFAWLSTSPYDRFCLMEDDLLNSEMPKDDFQYLCDKYHIGLIIFESAKENGYSSLQDMKTEEVFSNGQYKVYKIL
ncbi:hypothetical protein [Roseivirga ehrenbergii]|uniref:hypothetical protein n=1 Tax=Roseivirga ehrenbergii (strain DSM 102268 / JCM 13514 / KCTC 12282 / NCIMB 14502 / KMM 6017) TaxID=279360 RepID=UPI001052792A|nr:hypothetical protein [Roseivirga ehrenbergii]